MSFYVKSFLQLQLLLSIFSGKLFHDFKLSFSYLVRKQLQPKSTITQRYNILLLPSQPIYFTQFGKAQRWHRYQLQFIFLPKRKNGFPGGSQLYPSGVDCHWKRRFVWRLQNLLIFRGGEKSRKMSGRKETFWFWNFHWSFQIWAFFYFEIFLGF